MLEESDEDCEGESVGSDVEERTAEAPMPNNDAWEFLNGVNIDQRAARGVQNVRGGLTQQLDEGEDPVLGLFLRFFPMRLFETRLGEVRDNWMNMQISRHTIDWSKGKFLRFLGVLIYMCLHPLPNIEMHWRWPSEYAPRVGSGASTLGRIMREIEFKKYWQYMTNFG